MKFADVSMVRVYLTEHAHLSARIMKVLHDWEHARGVTVFRGIAGFGTSGHMHGVNFADLALDLPVVIEFYDVPEKIEKILVDLNEFIEPGHIVTWNVRMLIED